MNPEEFLKLARDPGAWRAKAVSLRRAADVVWDEFSRRTLTAIDKESKSFDGQKLSEATDVLRNCQLLYSLAAECAIKGLIIKQNQKEVIFEISVDGTDVIRGARIKQIGNMTIGTHALEKLAEAAGILKPEERPEVRELLAFSSFCIKWFGRYPVPLDTTPDFIPRGTLPGVVFNHYYRDFMDPFIDEVLEELDRE